jgi:hypothetical protein
MIGPCPGRLPPVTDETGTPEDTTTEPATDAGTTTTAGTSTSDEALAEQVAEQTDSLSPNADRAGTRERAVDPEQSGD